MFEADVQILLCLDKFQAINAKYTYPYCLAFKIYTSDNNGETIDALPHSIVSSFNPDSGGSIDAKLNCYISPYIKIQPNNYTVNIKQLCSFKLNMEWSDFANDSEISIQIFLYILNNSFALTPVGSQSLKIKKLTGRSSYLPILFESYQYTCYVDASIHTQLIGFKWKPSKVQLPISHIEEEEQIKPVKYANIKQYILGMTSMNKQKLSKLYSKYSNLLHHSIDKLQHFLSKMQNSSFQMKIPPQKKLSEITDPSLWGTLFLQNLNDLSGYCHQLWNLYIKDRCTFPDIDILKINYQRQLKYQFKKHIYYGIGIEGNTDEIVKKNLSNPQLIVGDLKFPRSVKVFIQQGDMFPINSKKKIQTNSENTKVQHIVFLVHGLAANRLAMETLKNILLYYYPHLKVVTSIANQFKTQEHIQEMGKRLSEEVRYFISSQNITQYKLTFIAHSLGGLITRAALLHLEFFKQHFSYFITLGTPHLGYLFHHSYLIKAGMWFLNRWKPSLSLLMLSFRDKQNLNESYLYRLSMQPGFQWFKNVILIANPGDSYVSEHSALIKLCPDAVQDKQDAGECGSLYCEMVENIQQRLDKTKVTRIIVHGMTCKSKGMDSIIGRTAHIQYLSDSTFLKMFVLTHSNLFIE